MPPVPTADHMKYRKYTSDKKSENIKDFLIWFIDFLKEFNLYAGYLYATSNVQR